MIPGIPESGGRRVSDYDYPLAPERIARYPAPRRDGSRLLVLDRETGSQRVGRFGDLTDLLGAGDVLVVNESRVIPARLLGRKPTGASAEILLLRPVEDGGAAPRAALDGPRSDSTAAPRGEPASGPGSAPGYTWEALVRPGAKLKPGRTVVVSDRLSVDIVGPAPGGGRIVRLLTDLPPMEALDRYGHVPLPPYIDRPDEALDRERYQTVYARTPGSVAAPTAGLHFTDVLLERIRDRGVEVSTVTLHVGPGTFRPVDGDDPGQHHMHTEFYHVPQETVAAVGAARRAGARVWAVGTTVVRTLESGARSGSLQAGPGSTDLFIRPPYAFKVVDGLVTNFHLPRSTLLMLVAAFGGFHPVMRAYRTAIEEGFRFYSYGDAMAIV